MAQTEIICGKNAVLEVLRARRRKCFEVYIAKGKRERTVEAVQTLAAKYDVRCREVSRRELDALSRVEKHQGIAARVAPFQFTPLRDIVGHQKQGQVDEVLLILDGILDPQNLGSLLRTAHQLGVRGVVVPRDNAAPVGPAATRAAAGATEYLAIAQVTNLVSELKFLKERGFWIYGAAAKGGSSLYAYDFTGHSVALIMGAEGKGIRSLVLRSCDHLVAIPMSGKLDSLNVSVAGGGILSEIMRQKLECSAKTP